MSRRVSSPALRHVLPRSRNGPAAPWIPCLVQRGSRRKVLEVALTVGLCFTTQSAFAQLAPPVGGGSTGSSGGPSFGSATDAVENGGLSVRVIFVGKHPDGKQLTVSAEVKNLSEDPSYVAIIGPTPTAVDTQGVSYELSGISGLATCERLETKYIQYCMTNNGNYLPGDAFSLLQPGASSVVALTLQSSAVSQAGYLSLTMSIARGSGARPGNETNKDRGLENVPFSFPLISLESQ